MKRFPVLVLAIAFLFLGVTPATPEPAGGDTTNAVKKGVEYLKKHQSANGMWSFTGFGDDTDIGTTALVGLALLESDVPKNDPAIQRAAGVLRHHSRELTHTYSISLIIMFLDRLGQPGDAQLIQILSMRLIAGQGAKGGWTYECPKLSGPEQEKLRKKLVDARPRALNLLRKGETAGATPIGGGNPAASTEDNSNTQFAILALWVARERHNVPAELPLAIIDKRFRSSQHKDGGWGYDLGSEINTVHGGSTPTMTCAGLLGLAIVHGLRDSVKEATLRSGDRPKEENKPEASTAAEVSKDQAVLAAQIYLSKNLPDLPKPGAPGAATDFPNVGQRPGDFYYYVWSIERVSMIYGWKTIGDKDWYAWGANILLPRQNADGSWAAGYPPAVDTAFALLFLKKANLAAELTTRLGGEAKLRVAGSEKKPAGTTTRDPATPTAKPDVPDAAQAEAAKLGAELLSANASRQQEIIERLQKAKATGKSNDHHTLALAKAIPKLSGNAKDKARTALAERISREATKTLLECLKSEDAEVRLASARAAALKQDVDATPGLIPLLSDSDANVGAAAYDALKDVTGKDFGKSPDPWKEWWAKQEKQ